jgi:predicted metalloprotease with PDZ domain
MVRNVVPDSPAWKAGLTFADEIVAVDGARVTNATFAKRVGDRRVGDRVKVAYFRRDELRETVVTLAESPERKVLVGPDPDAGKIARAVRERWLGV